MQQRKLVFSILSVFTLAMPACLDGEFGEFPEIPEIPDGEKPGSESDRPTSEAYCSKLCKTTERCGGEGLPDGMDSCLKECGLRLDQMAKAVPTEDCFALEVRALSCVLRRDSCEDWFKWLDWIDDEKLEGPAPLCEEQTRIVNERCWIPSE